MSYIILLQTQNVAAGIYSIQLIAADQIFSKQIID